MRRKGMIPCRVERFPFGPWLVSFGRVCRDTLYLQVDYDQAAFAVSCGAIKAPPGWKGDPLALGPAWENFDPETIEFCSDEYLAV